MSNMKTTTTTTTTILLFLFFLLISSTNIFEFVTANGDDGLLFNGFTSANLTLDGSAVITDDGLLQLTNDEIQEKGHAFYPFPFQFKNSTSGEALSFSSTFVFAIRPEFDQIGGNGIVFAVSPTTNFTDATGSQYFGILNSSDDGKPTNHLFFVELDTIRNEEIGDINYSHVGIDIDSVRSNKSYTAGFYSGSGQFTNLTLGSGDPMKVWVDYDGGTMKLDVTIAPINTSKPRIPLLSSTNNLTTVVRDQMFVGFSSSTGSFPTSHYILGWSFALNGKSQELNFSALPSLPLITEGRSGNLLAIWVSVAVTVFVLVVATVVIFVVRRRIKFAEVLENWEKEYKNHRFSYRDLYRATNGFRDRNLVGIGGFGRVYKGILPNSKEEVAVKVAKYDSTEIMRDFIPEIVRIGQLRHRNLLRQLGYCRRRGEILLVHDFMTNGSLDKLLFGTIQDNPTVPSSSFPSLPWRQRFHIVKGVASGLYYLHDEWEKVVIHRDIKASNVLLDENLNPRLGDFGLARLYDHGSIPRTTKVVGSIGYLAPELGRTGRATKATDVFSFGVLVLEVVCGRRPIEADAEAEEIVDWVMLNKKRGKLLEVIDLRMRTTGFVTEEIELVVELGLRCCQADPLARPSMRQVMEILEGVAPLPKLSIGLLKDSDLETPEKREEVEDYVVGSSSSSPLLTGS